MPILWPTISQSNAPTYLREDNPMPNADILTSIEGRRAGLSSEGAMVLNLPSGAQIQLGLQIDVTLSAAQVDSLFTTPVTVIPAPGAGYAIVVERVHAYLVAGTAFAGIAAGEDLVLKYTNAAGAQASGVIETTGFLDQATVQNRVVGFPGSTGATAGDVAPVENAAVVAALLVGDVTGGRALKLRIRYSVMQMAI